MNIAIFTDTFKPCTNGVADAVWRTAKGLRKAGNKVHLFALSDTNSNEVVDGVFIHKFKARELKTYKDYRIRFTSPIRKIFKIAKKEKFDVIHSHLHLSMGFCALLLSRVKKIPLIMTFHTLVPQYSQAFIEYYNENYKTKDSHEKIRVVRVMERTRIDKLLIRMNDKAIWWWLLYYNLGSWLITPSKFAKKILIKKGINNKKIVVVPNPIETRKVKKKVKNKKPLILHVGRLSPEKKVDVLIKALKHVKHDFKCVITSDGLLRNHLEKLAIQEDIADKVKFTGIISKKKLIDYYNKADVFVSPAIYDTFNNCVAESLIYNTPVIINKKSGATDFVKHGVNGIIVKNDDPREYALQIDSLLENNELNSTSSDIKDYTDINNITNLLQGVYTKASNTKTSKQVSSFLKYGIAAIFYYYLLALGEIGYGLREYWHQKVKVR